MGLHARTTLMPDGRRPEPGERPRVVALRPEIAATLPDPGSQSLGQRSARGAMWAVGGQVLSEPIRILGTAVLARLLTPADFGLIGMATVFFGLTAITTELGPASAIIARRRLSDEETSSLFWVSLVIGVILAALAVAAAPFVAEVYREPRVAPVFSAMSLMVLLSAAALVHNALLRRRMDFRIPAIANLSAVAVNSAVAIVSALLGAGYWSLVYGTLAGVVVSVTIVWRGARFRPMLRMRWSDVRPFVSFSTQVTGAELANYGSSNVDNLLVGRLLGTGALGFYALAYNLVTYPVRMFATLVAQVTLPALSLIRDDAERFRSAYLHATALSSTVVLPVLVAALVSAPYLIVGVYGDQWAGAVLPFQMLCLAGIGRSVSVFARSAFKAAGVPSHQLRWDLALLAGVALAALLGARAGVAAVAAAVAAATLAVSIGTQADVNRVLGLRASRVVRALAPAGGLGTGAALTTWAVASGLHASGLPPLAVAAIALPVSLLVTWAWGRFAFCEVRDLELLVGGTLRARRAATAASPARATGPAGR